MKKPAVLLSLDQFFFQVPLYAAHQLPDDNELRNRLYGRHSKAGRHLETMLDGHCPECHRDTPFTLSPVSVSTAAWENIDARHAFDMVSLRCARVDSHRLNYWFLIKGHVIEKIGQFPSLATISNDEVAPYRKHMREADAEEFHKAIGLAAHGVRPTDWRRGNAWCVAPPLFAA